MSTYTTVGVIRVNGAPSTPLAALVNPAASGVALVVRRLELLPIARGSALASGLLATGQLSSDDAPGSPPATIVERYSTTIAPTLRAGATAITPQALEYGAASAKALFYTNDTHEMIEPVGAISFNVPMVSIDVYNPWSLSIGQGQTCLVEAMETAGVRPSTS